MGISETIFIFALLYKTEAITFAVVAQLAERRLPKPQVTSSTLAYRSIHVFKSKVNIAGSLDLFVRKE